MDDGSASKSQASSGRFTNKREGYLEWPDYFMAIAFLSAQRSKDPRTQVGACIVNEEKKIVGIGYNGMPNGCSDDLMPWAREADSILDTKQLYVCHAELNAVLNKNSADVKNCTIYVALFPCNECAKVVIQSSIKEVVYYSDKYKDRPAFMAAKRMFDQAGVTYRQYQPSKKKIVIDFSLIEAMSDCVIADMDSLKINAPTVDSQPDSTS
ncbi:DCTD-like protein [Mya arenaria]|uniref:dCMP deaminase n=1 Tax=Mya arenaria TaxID=6604 RepID=A0ABY7DTG9_MYAAR|nr:deoxycytidylate deaminase-like [Mya arenaria]WAQ99977.1 DCTD-like protein [Mya arenaria]